MTEARMSAKLVHGTPSVTCLLDCLPTTMRQRRGVLLLLLQLRIPQQQRELLLTTYRYVLLCTNPPLRLGLEQCK